jgi:hypothetical protein
MDQSYKRETNVFGAVRRLDKSAETKGFSSHSLVRHGNDSCRKLIRLIGAAGDEAIGYGSVLALSLLVMAVAGCSA